MKREQEMVLVAVAARGLLRKKIICYYGGL